jgi:hypothetical protein
MASPYRERPLGVTILAILALIGGVFGVIGGLGAVFGGGVVGAVVNPGLGAVVALIGLAVLAVAIVTLALAYGFWTLKTWAWQLGFVLEVVNVGLQILQFLAGGASLWNLAVTLVVAGIVVYYLNTPDVRRAFAAPDSGFPLVGHALDGILTRK